MPVILHIMQCTNLGGMEQVAYRAMEELSRDDGMRFHATTPRPFGPGRDRVFAVDPDARDFPYRGRFGWRDFPAFRRHVRTLARECSHAWVTGTDAAALAALKDVRLPKVLSHHYHHFEKLGSWLRWRAFYELLCHQLDAITYPTDFTRREALRIAPWLKTRAVVVPNGYTMRYADEADYRRQRAQARARLGLGADDFIVGNAGWLIARKRFDVFLDTARRVASALPDVRFIICGGGPLQAYLEAQAAAMGLAGKVRFLGWVADIADHYRAWDVMLFNSDYDAMGSPPEAASYGCPTVASLTYGGLSEFIDHGRNGFIFPTHDCAVLAQTLVDLYRDRDRLAQMRAAARATIESRFSKDAGLAFYRRFFAQSAGGVR